MKGGSVTGLKSVTVVSPVVISNVVVVGGSVVVKSAKDGICKG